MTDSTVLVEKRTRIMGVLNCTPDSFSDGGMYSSVPAAVERAVQMAEEGADIIDIGGESSRPGSEPVPAREELERVMPVIQALKGKIEVPLSIDTYKSEVAREALAGGVSIVNDITALGGDPDMARTIAEFKAGVVLMHMKGDPRTMQDEPYYHDVVAEVYSFLSGAVDLAVSEGIDPEKIVVDPGIGFGKTAEHNLTILRELRRFLELGKPVLVGTSRKSFIGALTGKEIAARSFGTAASVAAAVMNGASMVRVHDVAAARDIVRVADAIAGEKE